MNSEGSGVFPVQGFVLAGGRSSRMGRDKVMLLFEGRPLVEVALEKLKPFCSSVAICGNRQDLGAMATIIPETRIGVGPAAGIEVGLQASLQAWTIFVPVDVPCVPSDLLKAWVSEVLRHESDGVRLSCMRAGGILQPAFCMLHRECLAVWQEALEAGERKLSSLFARVAESLGPDAMLTVVSEELCAAAGLSSTEGNRWFCNLNTPEDVAALGS